MMTIKTFKIERIFMVLLVCILNTQTATAKDIENYCHDSSVNKEWVTLLTQYPNDDAIAKLFAMRLGLCELVERGFIKHDRATEIFENARAKEVKEKRRHLNSQHGGV